MPVLRERFGGPAPRVSGLSAAVLQQHRIALTKTDEKTSQARFNLAFDDDGALKAKIGGVFNMGGAAVANYVSILEPLR